MIGWITIIDGNAMGFIHDCNEFIHNSYFSVNSFLVIMDKNWLINTLTISWSALGTWDFLFLTLKCDLKKNPKSKVSKTQKKKMFCYSAYNHLSFYEACNYCHQKGKKQFLFIFKVWSIEYEKHNPKKHWECLE